MKVISAKIANDFVKKHHYSAKVVNNSSLHFGCFLDGVLHGAMSFGCPLDKRKVLPLVHTQNGVPCLWNEMLELNRMAFDQHLPKNSESRCISIAFRLIKKNAPHIKWILSFSDASQCGDGAIYRASGFALTAIKKNTQIWQPPQSNARESRVTLTNGVGGEEQAKAKSLISRVSVTKGASITTDSLANGLPLVANGAASMKSYIAAGWRPLPGFQMRYIFLLDKTCKITVPILPFSEIERHGAGMYKGEKKGVQSIDGDVPNIQLGEGGSIPT